MDNKSYVIIGVGTFGLGVIRALSHSGVELMVIDRDAKCLEEVTEMVTNTVCADASDPEVLKNLGVKNFDGAIVAVGRDLESNVLITMQLKDLGVPFVMAKALSDLEGRVLTRVGADKVIFPEREMGIHVGNQIAYGNLFSSIELTENYSIVDYNTPASWTDKTIRQLNIRAKYGISIIGIRRGRGLEVNPQPDTVLKRGEALVILGENCRIKTLREKTK